jgi:hypothetical protein
MGCFYPYRLAPPRPRGFLFLDCLPPQLGDFDPDRVVAAPNWGALFLYQTVKREVSQLTDREALGQDAALGARRIVPS